ncbi:MAG: NUDIX hydrolase [Bacteroidales bacterium]|nr:NUDIX hydrolase [Bacteroidales bacterium]
MPEQTYQYPYPRPALTVDAVLFRYLGIRLQILLIKRGDEPFRDCWAFPGGFVEEGETVEEAVVREVEEETGVHVHNLEQVYTASKPGRDPRGWTVSVIFTGYISEGGDTLQAGDDAAEAVWHDLDQLPVLAFDHQEILDRVRKKIEHGGKS